MESITQKHCLIYLRVSSPKQAQQGESIEDQKKICEIVAERYKLKVLEVKYHEANEKRNKIIKEYLAEIPSPNLWKPVKDFSIDQASETIANAAFHAYTNLGGEKAPTLAVENWHPETVLSRGENFREFLDLSRKKCNKSGI